MTAQTHRPLRWLLVLIASGLFVGCAGTAQRPRPAPARDPIVDYRILESSLSQELTLAQKAQVWTKVEEVLAREHPERSGSYDVRVEFAPEKPGGEAEWVLVRISYLIPAGYEVVGYYPAGRVRGYDYYYDRYGYGIWGENYSDPFYYNPGYYVPPRTKDRDFSPRLPDDADKRRPRREPPPSVDPSPPRRPPDPPDSAPEFPRRDSPRHRPDYNRGDPNPRDREPPSPRTEPLGGEHGRHRGPETAPSSPPKEPPPRVDAPSNDNANSPRSTTDSERPVGRGNVRADRN